MLASVWLKDLNERIHVKCLVWYLVHGKHLRKKHCILLLIIIHIICVAVNLIWDKSLRHQFIRSVVSDSLPPHEPQHARPPCPSPTPRVYSNSCPSSQWCHPTISSSVVPFSSCLQSLPASESFPMSQLFAWGGQSTGVSASASFPPKKSQGWSSECNMA